MRARRAPAGGARRAGATTLVALLIAAGGGRAEARPRHTAVIVEPVEAALLERIRGQTVDLVDWAIDVVEAPADFPRAPSARARGLGARFSADAVLWFERTASGFRVVIGDVRRDQVTIRTVRLEPPVGHGRAAERRRRSLGAETVALIVRTSLRAIAAGQPPPQPSGEVGDPAETATESESGKNPAREVGAAADRASENRAAGEGTTPEGPLWPAPAREGAGAEATGLGGGASAAGNGGGGGSGGGEGAGVSEAPAATVADAPALPAERSEAPAVAVAGTSGQGQAWVVEGTFAWRVVPLGAGDPAQCAVLRLLAGAGRWALGLEGSASLKVDLTDPFSTIGLHRYALAAGVAHAFAHSEALSLFGSLWGGALAFHRETRANVPTVAPAAPETTVLPEVGLFAHGRWSVPGTDRFLALELTAGVDILAGRLSFQYAEVGSQQRVNRGNLWIIEPQIGLGLVFDALDGAQ